MAASLKVSELTSLTSVAAADLLLVADASATASKKVTLTNLEGSISLSNLGSRTISDLSNVASTSPSSGQVLAWNGSAWAPADPGHSTQASLGVDHLITLSGVAEGSDDLGTFSGSTITDSSTIKTALQELETAVEGSVGGATTVTTVSDATNANFYLTFVDSNNVSATAESVYTDAGVYYNPSTNQFNANGVNTGVLSINSVDVTSTAAELNVLDGITATTTELNYTDGVTSNIQTQLNAKQAIISGGDGITVSSNTVSVDLSSASTELVVSGYTSTQSFVNATYDIYTSFPGTISGSAGTSTMTWASNSSYNIYTDSAQARLIAYNTTESSWMIVFLASGLGTPSNGGTVTVSTAAYDLPTSSNVTVGGKNSPDASSWTEGTYSTGTEAFLEFTSGELHASVKDEDNMASDSATHLATQQSIKAYVDTTTGANETHIDNLVTLTGEPKDETNLGTFTGSTISDNGTIRAALQELETAVDNALGGGATAASVATVTRSTDATHYLTFVTDDNGSATQENIYTDAGVAYNPSSNILTVGEIVVSGNLTVSGTTTTLDSTTVQIDDKNIELGTVASPSNTTADGGGITLKGTTDKTINWINSTTNWTSSEHFDLASGKEYKINNVSVLSATTLGSSVVNSSLTSVGTLTALTVSGTTNLTGTFQLGGVSVTSTAAELNILDGVTATTAELNILDGVTATAAEINVLDGVTAFLDEDNMASDSATAIASQQSVKAYVDTVAAANETHIDNLVTLSGVAKDSTTLGTFTGTTIADSETIKGALQDLETALEGPLPVTIEAYNDTGGQLTKGDSVYISGTHSSGKPTVAKADSDGSNTFPSIGLIESTETSGDDDVTVVVSGILDGLNTSTFTAGDSLYLDTTPGTYTNTRPTAAGTEVQKIGVVTKSDASTGSVLITGANRTNDVPNELTALTGVALDAQNLGTFTGTIIADNETIKGALQDLEDELGSITLTNLDINGGSAITIADADKVPFYDVSGTTNGNTTATLLADYVASKKTVKQLANVGTTADSEPTNYYFLAVDASNGNIVILNKEFVETEGSP